MSNELHVRLSSDMQEFFEIIGVNKSEFARDALKKYMGEYSYILKRRRAECQEELKGIDEKLRVLGDKEVQKESSLDKIVKDFMLFDRQTRTDRENLWWIKQKLVKNEYRGLSFSKEEILGYCKECVKSKGD